MFDCITCGKAYTYKSNLTRHTKVHDGSKISCGICAKVFTQQTNLSRHTKNIHRTEAARHTNDDRNVVRIIGGATDRHTVINWAPALATTQPSVAVLSPTAAVITNRRAQAAGPSHASTTSHTFTISTTPAAHDDTPVITGISAECNRTFDRDNTTCPLPTLSQQLMRYTENSGNNIELKKARMQSVNTPGFIELKSSLNRTTVWYFRKNIDDIKSYRAFLHSIESELLVKLRECVISHPIKYNLKLEATYATVPNVDNTRENRAFKSSARELYSHSNVEGVVDRDFTALLAEENGYAVKDSGFALSCIDGMLLVVYEYSPMGGSSHLALPQSISDQNSVINPQKKDLQCFKWAILAKHLPQWRF